MLIVGPKQGHDFWREAKNFCVTELSKLLHLLFFKSTLSLDRLIFGKFPKFGDFWPENPKKFKTVFICPKMQRNIRLSLDAQHHSNRLWNTGYTDNSRSFPCFCTFWMLLSFFTMQYKNALRMHMLITDRLKKLQLQTDEKFQSCMFTCERDKHGVGFVSRRSSRKNQFFQKCGKVFGYVWNFWKLDLFVINLWNVFDRPGDIRTTNKCKNWNKGWNDLIWV